MINGGVLAVVALIVVSGFLLGKIHDYLPILSVYGGIVIVIMVSLCLGTMIDTTEKSNFDLALKCAENGIECTITDIESFEKRLSKEAVLRAKAGEFIDIESVLSFVSEKDSD